MKHTPPAPPYLPVNPRPSSPVMRDEDWEEFVQQKLNEEADFFNSTAPLAEKMHV